MTHIEIVDERDKLLFSQKRFPFDLGDMATYRDTYLSKSNCIYSG